MSILIFIIGWNTTIQNLCYIFKAVNWGKFEALKILSIQKKFKLNSQLIKLKKKKKQPPPSQQQNKPKYSTKKEIINIKTEINEGGNRKTAYVISKTRYQFL